MKKKIKNWLEKGTAMKKKIKKQAATSNYPYNHPYKIGQAYLIRTVTNFFTGKLVEVFQQELEFSECAWIADTGRFSDALKNGTLNEIEPIFSNLIIGRGALVDACEWNHGLPKEQK